MTTAMLAGLVMLAGATTSPAQQPPTFTPREETADEFPDHAGRDDTFYFCSACHGFKIVAAQGMTRPQWDDSLSWMVQKHNMPPLDGKEREVILDYLAAAFPPRASPGSANPFLKR